VIIAGIPIATVASAIARASIMTIPLDSASSSTSIGSLRNRFADQHLPHACFRRISPQRFWFRGLWRKPGQRFAVCGGNPAWQVHVSLLADMWPPWRLTHPELPGHKATLAKLAFVDLQQRLLSSIPAFLRALKARRKTLQRLVDGEEGQALSAAARAFVDGSTGPRVHNFMPAGASW
jgi:hypothetical protein